MSHQVFWFSWQLAKISDEAEKNAIFLSPKNALLGAVRSQKRRNILAITCMHFGDRIPHTHSSHHIITYTWRQEKSFCIACHPNLWGGLTQMMGQCVHNQWGACDVYQGSCSIVFHPGLGLLNSWHKNVCTFGKFMLIDIINFLVVGSA
jgi:hypothetical protein